MSPELAQQTILGFEVKFPNMNCISIIGVADLSHKPYYLALCQSKNKNQSFYLKKQRNRNNNNVITSQIKEQQQHHLNHTTQSIHAQYAPNISSFSSREMSSIRNIDPIVNNI